jgi:hypothetical protein
LVRQSRPCIPSPAAPTKNNEFPVPNNNSASAKDALRTMLLRDREDCERERQELIELEASGREWLLRQESLGVNCSPAREGWKEAMADLAESKLETERILQYFDKIGRPATRMGAYRKHRLEAIQAFPGNKKEAKKRFRFRSGLEPPRARAVWLMLEREDEK